MFQIKESKEKKENPLGLKYLTFYGKAQIYKNTAESSVLLTMINYC